MSEPGERAADRAYRMVRRDIADGTLGAGKRLGEAELAERYGASRTPIREALRRLESEGMVEVLPHRGARVMDWSGIDVEAVYDLRAMIEGYAARRAATRISSDEVDRLSLLCDEMERLTDENAVADDGDDDDNEQGLERMDAMAQLNEQLHSSVASLADVHHITALRSIVFVVPLVQRMVHRATIDDQRRSNQHHRDLLAAFRAQDGSWAETIMASHVQAAKVRLLRIGDQPA